MNDEISTEEQEQVKHIISRWQINVKWVIPLFLASIAAPFVISMVIKSHTTKFFSDLVFYVVLIVGCYTPRLITRWKVKKVVRSLTEDEREMLARSANIIQGSDEEKAVRKALQHYRVHPKKVLLRPSQETDDNTLLRAATQTEDTAQEQLLRPTQSHDV